MLRRSIFGFWAAIVALLALATPALAGGWAVVTLDSLPREVRAGASFQLGFTVLQHGKTPTNLDLNGKPLKPVITAVKQGDKAATTSTAAESIRAEARLSSIGSLRDVRYAVLETNGKISFLTGG